MGHKVQKDLSNPNVFFGFFLIVVLLTNYQGSDGGDRDIGQLADSTSVVRTELIVALL